MERSPKPVHKPGKRQPQQQRLAPSGPSCLVQVKTEMPLARSQKPGEKPRERRDHHGDKLLLGQDNSVGQCNSSILPDAALQTTGEGNARTTSRLKRKPAPGKAIGECKQGRKKKRVVNDDNKGGDAGRTPRASDDSNEEDAEERPVANADNHCEASEALRAATAPAVDKGAPEIARMLAACADAVETTVLDTKKLNSAIDQLMMKTANGANADRTDAAIRDVCHRTVSPLLASIMPEVIADMREAMIPGLIKEIRSTCRVAIREALREGLRSEFREYGMNLPPSRARNQDHHRNCHDRSPARRELNSRTGPEEDPYSSSASVDRPGRRVTRSVGRQERPDYRMNRGRTPSERPGVHTVGGNSHRGPDMLPRPPCPAYRSSLPPLRHGYDSSPVWHLPLASHDQQPRREEPRYGSRREEPRYDSRREEPRYDSRREEPRYDSRREEPRYDSRREEPRYDSRREEPRYGSRIREPSYGRGQSSFEQASYQQAPNSRHRGWSASQPRWISNCADDNAPYDCMFNSMDSRRGR